jgi:uncharacterized protein with FMN-binding domain
MNTKNIAIITFITIFGLGLFVVFFNVFSQQATPKNDNLTSVSTDTPATFLPATIENKPVTTTQTTPINTTTVDSGTTTTKTGSQTTTTTISNQKTGTYNFKVNYRVPEGHTENIASTISVENDIITGIKNTYGVSNRESREYQSSFDDVISSKIVGKKISSVDVSRVGGASLTTAAFMKGIRTIK